MLCRLCTYLLFIHSGCSAVNTRTIICDYHSNHLFKLGTSERGKDARNGVPGLIDLLRGWGQRLQAGGQHSFTDVAIFQPLKTYLFKFTNCKLSHWHHNKGWLGSPDVLTINQTQVTWSRIVKYLNMANVSHKHRYSYRSWANITMSLLAGFELCTNKLWSKIGLNSGFAKRYLTNEIQVTWRLHHNYTEYTWPNWMKPTTGF